MSATLPDQDAADRRSAHRTGLSFSAVNAVALLKAAAAAAGIHIVGNRGATPLDGLDQHFLNRPIQAAGTLAREPGGDGSRVDAGAVQRLIGINISHPAQESLIEQEWLDQRLPRAQAGDESIRRDRQRVRTKLVQAGGELGAQLDAAELADIVVD